MITKSAVTEWMERLKAAWTTRDVEGAVALFRSTKRYYERPFHAGTTEEEIRKYWQDIVTLRNITLDYDVVAVDGDVACVHWVNRFFSPSDARDSLLDGVFVIHFDKNGNCVEFHQWWFMGP